MSTHSSPVRVSTQPSYAPSLPSGPPASSCPNATFSPSCLGRLQAGKAYTTTAFTPTLTYRVPAANWFNDEDELGNFLLVPPRNTLQGVDAGTSDYLGVYTFVTGAKLTKTAGCETTPIPSTSTSPQAMVRYFRAEADLSVSNPVPVSIGGLSGLTIDVRLKQRAKHIYCTFNGEPSVAAGLFNGLAPADFEHAVVPGVTLRLYLLSYRNAAYRNGVLGIEMDDVEKAPGTMAQLDAVARSLKFGT